MAKKVTTTLALEIEVDAAQQASYEQKVGKGADPLRAAATTLVSRVTGGPGYVDTVPNRMAALSGKTLGEVLIAAGVKKAEATAATAAVKAAEPPKP
jgi:hypothetical protein